MKNTNNIIYWVATGLLCLMMLMSAGMYFFKFDEVSEVFMSLGFPTFIIYPLAILKILGIIAILSNKSFLLKEWAYAGFFFDFILAFAAHAHASDGEYAPSLIAIALLIVSYYYDKKRTL